VRSATSGVPLEIWWSTKDRVVTDQDRNSRALFDRIARFDPHAPVIGVVGSWKHTAEMWYFRKLPAALESLGLLPAPGTHAAAAGRREPAAESFAVLRRALPRETFETPARVRRWPKIGRHAAPR
jgi:hypothetical protein